MKTDERTKDMWITEDIGERAVIGAPIYIQDSQSFGTICGMDLYPRKFTRKEHHLFKMMADLLGSVIDADIEQRRVESAAVPLVPLGQGVTILPLTGLFSEQRARLVVDKVLRYCAEEDVDYMIIDSSGLITEESEMTDKLLYLIECLILVGAETVLTGVRPDQAQLLHKQNLSADRVAIAPSMPEALRRIGLKLTTSAEELEPSAQEKVEAEQKKEEQEQQ
ncbi:hypothetical protein C6I21_00245 [Alkalicoccus urumqiensis]|uniref:STAS domain-containing protein n=1 Tax=Alkalicoccus urumqiensis TaxID=1548213 RepID=A0A2P6ML78_ALKUR|nr:hypothetical protein C6I21_00245 [Alkalicoccus urumqiensis]